MATGKVKWFNETKGFGFVLPDDGGGEVFVRPTDMEKAGLKTLKQGQSVSFEYESLPSGNAAAADLKTG